MLDEEEGGRARAQRSAIAAQASAGVAVVTEDSSSSEGSAGAAAADIAFCGLHSLGSLVPGFLVCTSTQVRSGKGQGQQRESDRPPRSREMGTVPLYHPGGEMSTPTTSGSWEGT